MTNTNRFYFSLSRLSLCVAFVICLCLMALSVMPGADSPVSAKKGPAASPSASERGAVAAAGKVKSPPAAAAVQAGPQTVGRWDTQEREFLDTVPVHISLLPDGRLLYWGRDKAPDNWDRGGSIWSGSSSYLWHPISKARAMIFNPTTNLFCAGHSFLPDGRLLVTGGHDRFDGDDTHPGTPDVEGIGEKDVNIFDYRNNTWTLAAQMPKGRWYPSNVTMANGEAAIFSGSYWDGTFGFMSPRFVPKTKTNENPEIYTQAGTLRQFSASFSQVNYPYAHLAPNGKVFLAGPTISELDRSKYFDPEGNGGQGLFTDLCNFPEGDARKCRLVDIHFEGASVLYDSVKGKVLVAGGQTSIAAAKLTAAKVVDLTDAPYWQPVAPMSYGRKYHNATILPDGKVLVTGGTGCPGGNNVECAGGALIPPELWDPEQPQAAWKVMANSPSGVPRVYHSTALLLPDARVLVGGGGLPAAKGEFVGGVKCIDNRVECRNYGHNDVEFFSPPYLFDDSGNPAPRPVINSAPAEVGYGQQFSVTFSNSATIQKVTWIRLPSVSHGINWDQRINVLNFAASGAGQLTVTAPSDPRQSPPGHYMLFVMRQGNGGKLVPSVAKIVRIGSDVTPPPQLNREDFIARRSIRHNNRIHVFYRHLNDTALRYVSQTAPDSRTFSAPVNLGGGLNSNPIAIKNQDGRLQVFVLGLDNSFYTNRETAPGSGTWTGFVKLAGTANLPVIAAARNLDGRIQAFYRGGDNALWYITQTAANSTTWDAPVSLGGGLTSEPAVGMNADGRLEVFVRGLDNALYHNWQTTPGGAWSGFAPLGGQLTSGPFVAHNSDGRLSVFVRGTDNGVWHNRQLAPNSSGSWSGYEGLGGTLAGDHPYNSPSAALGPDGRLQVFVRWGDNTLRTLVQNAPNENFPWNAWDNLWGWIDATVPPPARSNDGRLFIFVRGGGYNLYFNSHTAPNSYNIWDGFAYLGDVAHSF